MAIASRTTVTCPQCRTPYPATVEMVIDVAQDPDAKLRLMNGRLNLAQCPNCGTAITVASPLVYHDASKELLITFIPMELGLPKEQQEKVTGDLLRELTKVVPQGSMRGYFFQPRQALTMQGLLEQILQADGVTPEMMAQQKQRARLIEQFLQATDDVLPSLVAQYDAEIDGTFLQTMGLFAQRALQDGAREAAQQIMMTQQMVMQLSTYGKGIIAESQAQERVVREVEVELRALGPEATRETFANIAVKYIDDDMRLQAMVGLARPAFDAEFFSQFTLRIAAAPAEDRDALEGLRTRLEELVAAVDAEAQETLQEAAALLQAILQTPDSGQFIAENAHMFDDAFMAVLTANLQNAEQTGNIQASARLRQIYEQVVQALQSQMSPELRFINQILTTPSPEAAEELIRNEGAQYGEGLVSALDALAQTLEARGDNPLVVERIRHLRGVAASVIAQA
jgi:uncharacterized protein YdhG (YjbR/CyaY superfamily)